MDLMKIMAALAETYWDRPADEAELVAMAGEAMRDKTSIAKPLTGKAGALFNTEPAHFEAVLRVEAGR
ncbi:hypothetical protein LAV84_17675 [Rhizobium sp. VS19-DR104.2]|uniref:hypothetical protein n=1 Tax=unclassified Rhizobium TaxID=2613769 RepID=UPI001CC627F4|nr:MULTISPECIES: hypothetical protein [unclassified Rhizobium]MBZ5761259.1 hypothetical protein [Rhizobium sp. VS19-DR96]MBZ5767013.1 hypothetical protein [Rhizobium sp. VS19-DR129.2]MBZ5774898.1 hypothetical protein [Rhizobium sp. VS19-DRK62.2]MBZ5785691.1 hypothetical protein [Rhizobium sp. VS19-DR121]MBZ5803117.1 hypothetical protein [Rhizobium sp. VS19-DR181]